MERWIIFSVVGVYRILFWMTYSSRTIQFNSIRFSQFTSFFVVEVEIKTKDYLTSFSPLLIAFWDEKHKIQMNGFSLSEIFTWIKTRLPLSSPRYRTLLGKIRNLKYVISWSFFSGHSSWFLLWEIQFNLIFKRGEILEKKCLSF